MRNAIWKVSDRVQQNTEKLVQLKDQLTAVSELQTSMNDQIQQHAEKIIALNKDLYMTNENKVDKTTFKQFESETEENYLGIRQRVDNMAHDINMTGNYLQKFVPMQIQRAITHVVSFVWPQRDVAWRMNWYNELRMPMLSMALLTDEGRCNLQKKKQELIAFCQANPTAIMEINGEFGEIMNKKELMKDEQLMSKVLGSMKLHAKAKMVIFEKLD